MSVPAKNSGLEDYSTDLCSLHACHGVIASHRGGDSGASRRRQPMSEAPSQVNCGECKHAQASWGKSFEPVTGLSCIIQESRNRLRDLKKLLFASILFLPRGHGGNSTRKNEAGINHCHQQANKNSILQRQQRTYSSAHATAKFKHTLIGLEVLLKHTLSWQHGSLISRFEAKAYRDSNALGSKPFEEVHEILQ
ncbi:hypothetical protein BDZ45DRAFT_748595 [Acephala macrosclerotiorum]|nr:hypothetical protein BDZ45DRAFT_748595 [Acephala macrosclerotiorum]